MTTTLSAFTPQSRVLDAGCGPGAVTLAILAKEPTSAISAIDTSEKMLSDLATNLQANKLSVPNLQTKILDVHDILSTYNPDSFSHMFASFVLHVATTDFAGGVREMYTALKPGGVFALATFTPHAEPYVIWDRVCRIFDPDYVQASYALDPQAWSSPGQLAAGMQKTGFIDIKVLLRRAEFPISTVDGWAAFWFDGKNPAGEAVVRPFIENHEGLGVEEVMEVHKRVVKE
ncbi:S-adenosyl-L-methionine-dependent methyltransferase [Setomelanomma holmii]|uniref:S-adenosyl-L-methionine-dependent methyltransferase n=1 Tax=Setomelanomma holmii TaxID=210430 RepID=A0A9P4HF84_9PLEO|nr:S-adenosyl-L-methionine-dependent methyltransferase [Setomelanomma holmii]